MAGTGIGLDADGNREIMRNPYGEAIRYDGSKWLPNLITNGGLNRVATIRVIRALTTPPQWRRRFAIGTDSTPHVVTQDTLGNEVQRGEATFGTADEYAFELDTGDNVVRASYIARRQITLSADRNLTEYGLSESSTANTAINVCDLFRDEIGTPITISILAGKIIRIEHELIIEAPAPAAGTAGVINIEEYDVGNALVGVTPYSVTYGPTGLVGRYFDSAWEPSVEPSFNRVTSASTYDRVTAPPRATVDASVTVDAYVSDSRQRTKRAFMTTEGGNGEWYGINVAATASGAAFFTMLFTSPALFTKANTHTLEVGTISSWDRA